MNRKRSVVVSWSSSYLSLDKRRFVERSARQEQRIYELEQREGLNPEEILELEGLRRKTLFVEQYDPSAFTAYHVQFKQRHNQVFASLCHYCDCNDNRNVFFLDGKDAGTSSTLLAAGLDLNCCYTANRHETTCLALTEWGLQHVIHASAAEALRGVFANISFAAYYFDGCGGHPPVIVDMLTAALDKETRLIPEPPIAIGISIVGGNRDVVNKELYVVRALVKLAAAHNLRVHHVLENCERYDVEDTTISRVEGSTLTSWFLLDADRKTLTIDL